MDDPPQLIGRLQRPMPERVLNYLVGFGRKSAETLPIGNCRTMLGAGDRHHGHVAAEGSDYFVNGFQFLCHTPINSYFLKIVNPEILDGTFFFYEQ
jgi:hypothetical protein